MNPYLPPCKNPYGADCANRHVGCQSQCKKYMEFRAAMDDAIKKRALNAICADYACTQIFKDRRKLRHTADGRRALAQR